MTGKYRGGQLTPMPWSSHSPNGNFSLLNISNPALWMPVHPDYARVNVEKRQSWVKLISDLHHFRLDHLYSDVQPSGRPLPSSTNYLFHYIDSSIVVVEQHFDRRSTSPSSSPGVGGQPVGGTVHQEDFDSLVSQSVPAVPPSTRYRYVLFVNLGNETLIKDFSDKFYFSMTQLATNANRTSEFLIMKALKLDPGEAMIATVE
ncbi:hypothetical protein TYRP_013645 [Tyrophagus putrescentiae]|nr:hypothetical protein TYRP_013645 [Tyrophagus putrescentiae]